LSDFCCRLVPYKHLVLTDMSDQVSCSVSWLKTVYCFDSTWQATASVHPQLWQPASGIIMRNDINDTCSEGAMPCMALSKNDSYVMSGSGGKVSLFNMMTFKVSTISFF
jgi:hypothetical protein